MRTVWTATGVTVALALMISPVYAHADSTGGSSGQDIAASGDEIRATPGLGPSQEQVTTKDPGTAPATTRDAPESSDSAQDSVAGTAQNSAGKDDNANDVRALVAPSLALTPSTAVSGDSVTVTGVAATSGVPGAVTIEQRTNGGAWHPVTSTTTDAAGNWAVAITATRNAQVRATFAGEASTPATLTVRPRLSLPARIPGRTLVGATLSAQVLPAGYSGAASIVVNPKSGPSTTTDVQVRNGSLTAQLPMDFMGRASVQVTLAQTADWSSTSESTSAKATVRKLRSGRRGPDVKALILKLRSLGFHTPKPSQRYGKQAGDVVLAFRKSEGLRRTKTMDRRTWRKVLTAKPMRPRYDKSGTYLEVDKTRQIMMLVRNGKVQGTLHVSTGATGNTPEGTYAIFQRGGSYLYRFMAFKGNFGIHGYVPVPPYPASHGCVREPMWAADWTYRNTGYGTPVIVYR